MPQRSFVGIFCLYHMRKTTDGTFYMIPFIFEKPFESGSHDVYQNRQCMKRWIFLVLIFFSLSSMAEQPPATYQQLKAEFVNLRMDQALSSDMRAGLKLRMSRQTKIWIGVGTGVATTAVAGYFFIKGQRQQYQDALLIGGAVYLPVLVVLTLSEEKRSRGPYG